MAHVVAVPCFSSQNVSSSYPLALHLQKKKKMEQRNPSFSQSLIVSMYPICGHFTLNSRQAGGIAGTSVDLLFFPIDTVKTRLQSSQGFWRAGGLSKMYKGVGSVMVGSAPGGSGFFNMGATYLHSCHL